MARQAHQLVVARLVVLRVVHPGTHPGGPQAVVPVVLAVVHLVERMELRSTSRC